MEKQHIDPKRFKDNLTQEEFAHLTSCPFCRERFADYIETQELITAPKHLKSDILERSRNLDVQIIAGSNHLSKRLQLFYFSRKPSAVRRIRLQLLQKLPCTALIKPMQPVKPGMR